MEPVGPTTFSLSRGEQRVLGVDQEQIELDQIDLQAAHQRIDDAYAILQTIYTADDESEHGHEERLMAAYAYTELAVERTVLDGIGRTLAANCVIDATSLTPEDIIGR